MPFISNYREAMQILKEIKTGKCPGPCKTVWMRNLTYALKTKTNPLALTKTQRRIMTDTMTGVRTGVRAGVSGKRAINKHSKTLKQYKNR